MVPDAPGDREHEPGATEGSGQTDAPLDSWARARRHPIVADRPAVNFFEGALLGNGALGVVVSTRPDAVVIHLGHNNVWDIRLAEHTLEDIGTFAEICRRVKGVLPGVTSLDEEDWYRDYRQRIERNYRQKPYPVPSRAAACCLGLTAAAPSCSGTRWISLPDSARSGSWWSKAGFRLRILVPWRQGATITSAAGTWSTADAELALATELDESITLRAALPGTNASAHTDR